MYSIANVIDSHKSFLKIEYPKHLQRYCDRLENQPESAKAEAISCYFFRTRCDDVQVEEDLQKGGVDFRCKSKDGTEFVSEVTCFEAEAAAAQSKLPNEFPENELNIGGPFAMVNHRLLSKAVRKAKQISGYCCPRILVITCEHIMSEILLGKPGAELLLTSEPEILEPVGNLGNTSELGNVNSVTDLRHSVFFRLKNGKLESCRRSISAILLFSIFPDKTSVVGLLHPDPEYKFPIRALPLMPFLILKQWPPQNNKIEKEWVIHDPKPDKFYHHSFDYSPRYRKIRTLFK